jgi:hypothetical protein
MVTDTILRSALTSDLDAVFSQRAATLAEAIASAFGPNTAAVLHYGSHVHAAGHPHDSAYDFFVVVDENAAAFRHFTRQMRPRFSAGTATLLSRVLPPNIVAVRLNGSTGGATVNAKCAILSARQLVRTCAPRSQDHFTKGRLFQPVRLAWVRDAACRTLVEDALVSARAGTLEWVRPHLPAEFDIEAYCRTLLRTSYAGEIRPETSDRAEQLFQAQRCGLIALYEPLLRDLAVQGTLLPSGGGYREARPPSRGERARLQFYFKRSKARATARWFKYIWLYDGWLEYIHRKVERRGGTVIELTPREKQWPLLFLWPKAIRFLRSRR